MGEEFIKLLEKRRSVRHFADKKVETEKIETIIKAALSSPSSKNTRPWHFYVVENSNTIASLSQSKPMGGRFLKDAPLAIVVAADQNKTDMWVEDCSIASTIIQLMAESLGLSSCWIQIRGRYNDEQQGIMAEDYIHKLLDIEDHQRIENIIAIGYKLNEPKPHDKEEDSDKVTYIG